MRYLRLARRAPAAFGAATRIGGAALAAAAVLAACGTPAAPPAEDAPAPAADAPAPLWSEAGLAAQPRLDQLRRDTPPELGFRPATTGWRPVARAAAVEPLAAATPGELLLRIVDAVGAAAALGSDVWEHTLRIQPVADDRAVAVVMAWGLKDDALAGHDLRAALRRGSDGWRVERVEERFHCARGVTEDGLCI